MKLQTHNKIDTRSNLYLNKYITLHLTYHIVIFLIYFPYLFLKKLDLNTTCQGYYPLNINISKNDYEPYSYKSCLEIYMKLK